MLFADTGCPLDTNGDEGTLINAPVKFTCSYGLVGLVNECTWNQAGVVLNNSWERILIPDVLRLGS